MRASYRPLVVRAGRGVGSAARLALAHNVFGLQLLDAAGAYPTFTISFCRAAFDTTAPQARESGGAGSSVAWARTSSIRNPTSPQASRQPRAYSSKASIALSLQFGTTESACSTALSIPDWAACQEKRSEVMVFPPFDGGQPSVAAPRPSHPRTGLSLQVQTCPSQSFVLNSHHDKEQSNPARMPGLPWPLRSDA